ncbi:MAG: hypothetical protein FJZ57_07010 [Chlamydiae bacterium]|nr:hypothetical protein [Chlamydiota bacterium]
MTPCGSNKLSEITPFQTYTETVSSLDQNPELERRHRSFFDVFARMTSCFNGVIFGFNNRSVTTHSSKNLAKICSLEEEKQFNEEDCFVDLSLANVTTIDDENEEFVFPNGRLSLIREIARGSFGVVFQASYSTSTQKKAMNVAAKINIQHQESINNSFTIDSFNNEAGFLKEIKKLDTNDNHHIVRFIDFFQISINEVCLVLEYGDLNLKEFINQNKNTGGVSLARTAKIMEQIFKALNFLHTRRPCIIHNDLKPANILVSLKPYPKIKIADFGVASKGIQRNLNNDYLCTRWYRSPEFVLGSPYSSGSDMWSSSCIAFEIHSGEALFSADSQNDLLIMHSQLLGSVSADFYKLIHPSIKHKFQPSFYGGDSFQLKAENVSNPSFENRWDFFNKHMAKNGNEDDDMHSKENYILFRSMLFDIFKWFPGRRATAFKSLNSGFIKKLQTLNTVASNSDQEHTITTAFS